MNNEMGGRGERKMGKEVSRGGMTTRLAAKCKTATTFGSDSRRPGQNWTQTHTEYVSQELSLEPICAYIVQLLGVYT